MNRQRVLLVDDDLHIRRLLQQTLARGGYEALEAMTAAEALDRARADRPDAILLDLGLPDRDGLELVQLLKARGATVVVVSAREDTAEKVAALDLGADDYLTKPFDTEELLARVRTALRHRLGASGAHAVVTVGDVTIDLERRHVQRGGVKVHLSPKEYGVFAELAKRPGCIVGHAQLLRDVWGPAHEQSLEYLRIVIRNLRQKLEDDPSRPVLIRNELGVGYRLSAPR